jgi:outer membrane immunogenic protein
MFRRLLLASAGAIALSGAALAAEPLPAPPPPPPPWTGFYLGLNGGGTWGSDNTVDVNSVAIPNPAFAPGSTVAGLAGGLGATADLSVSSGGFIGGGQLGYNYQFTNSFVAGIEADIQGIAGSNNTDLVFRTVPIVDTPDFADTRLSTSKKLDYLGTLRGRLGFLAGPTFLIYGTGGLAYGGTDGHTFWSQDLVGPATIGVNTPYSSNGSVSDTHAGWTAGGGVEWMFLPNWSVKVEYLYYDLGSVTFSNGFARNVTTIAPAGQTFYSVATQSSSRFDGNIVRAGINYHFNWLPAPVVAKY